MPPRVKTVASITVEKFYDSHAKALSLELLGENWSDSTAPSASPR